MVELIILNRQGISEVDKKVLALGVHWVVGPAFSNQKKFPIFSISRLQNDFFAEFPNSIEICGNVYFGKSARIPL